ncbi:MAG TPA: hypothetical protein VIM73_10705 [Polyangiaceae bacterium]
MVPSKIPEPVEEFIRRHIHSVLQLEVLLWLRERGTPSTMHEVAAELRVTEQSAAIRLRDLVYRDLVREDPERGEFRYEPASTELGSLVDQLAELYALASHSVINLIFSVPGDSARSLADAFRFRRKRED